MMQTLQQQTGQGLRATSSGRQLRMSAVRTLHSQRLGSSMVSVRQQCPHRTSRGSLHIVAGERQTGNVATKRRLSGPPGLPPINGDDGGGGGGGGDGWGWERTARNVLPNLVFLGMYFAITSYGGDGWGGGGGGGGDGGGGGGGGGGWEGSGRPADSNAMHEDAAGGNDQEEGSRPGNASDDDEAAAAAPVYSYRGGRSHYR